MTRYSNKIGVSVPEVLLPPANTDFSKWAVVACDQYTSQPEYWEEAGRIVGDAPSTLNLILPEAYLGKPEEEAKIQSVHKFMKQYVENGLLETKEQGFVFVKRFAEGKMRNGLVMALDLEHYDYNKGATTLIRATEGTIVDRIPPRLRIREGAELELPHILVLIDDPKCTVIEPLEAKIDELEKVYDTDLMLGGGHIEGYLVSKPELVQNIIDALEKLADPAVFKEKYGEEKAPMLFAMGDGNHSFATAKASWEKIKTTLSAEERETHPARFALVEVENVHDAGIIFEPIHRIVFGVEPKAALSYLEQRLAADNGGVTVEYFADHAALDAAMAAKTEGHVLPFYYAGGCGLFSVEKPAQQLAVGTLQNAIDALIKETAGSEVDYIHGADVVLNLAERADAIGFLLRGMEKSDLFPTVMLDGALPRKTFSMGEACEKRYYLECKRILPATEE